MVPVQARGSEAKHWTLLVRDEAASRYFDTLRNKHKVCHERAIQIASFLEGKSKDEVKLNRGNKIRQENADCVFLF